MNTNKDFNNILAEAIKKQDVMKTYELRKDVENQIIIIDEFIEAALRSIWKGNYRAARDIVLSAEKIIPIIEDMLENLGGNCEAEESEEDEEDADKDKPE